MAANGRRLVSRLLLIFVSSLFFVAVTVSGKAYCEEPRKIAAEPVNPSEQQAEYHFHLANAYLKMDLLGKAHLHFEIIHDRYPNSARFSEATGEMQLLRNQPRVKSDQELLWIDPQGAAHSCGGVLCLNALRHLSAKDFETPSMNPQTLLDLEAIWPAVESKDAPGSVKVYVEGCQPSFFGQFPAFGPRTLAGIPLREGRYQLLDSPYFGSFQNDEEQSGNSQPSRRWGPGYNCGGPPLVF